MTGAGRGDRVRPRRPRRGRAGRGRLHRRDRRPAARRHDAARRDRPRRRGGRARLLRRQLRPPDPRRAGARRRRRRSTRPGWAGSRACAPTPPGCRTPSWTRRPSSTRATRPSSRRGVDDLRAHLPNLRIVGGCCGTDSRHVAASGASDARRSTSGDTTAWTGAPQGAARLPGVDVLRTKSVEQSLKDTEDPEFKLKRRLTALDLTVFGVGVIIGAGIFTLTGRVAQANAGPGGLALVRAGRCVLRARSAVLRRVRLDGAGVRVGVHVLLRHPRRADRLDHRLGPAARDDARRVGRGAGLGVVLRDVPRPGRHRLARRARLRRRLQPRGVPAGRDPHRARRPTGSRSRCGSTWCWWRSSSSSSCS